MHEVKRRIPLAEFLGWFTTGAVGHIVRLQTTFMKIAFHRCDLPAVARITYHSKRTFHLRHGPVERVHFVRDHPMLARFNPKSDRILFFDDAYVIGKGFIVEVMEDAPPIQPGTSG